MLAAFGTTPARVLRDEEASGRDPVPIHPVLSQAHWPNARARARDARAPEPEDLQPQTAPPQPNQFLT